MDNIVCIYKITNTVTGDFYIGQTINFHERQLQHKRDPQPKMRDDVEKYGWDAFKFEILEECAREVLNDKENEYITKLDPAYNTIKIHNWTHTPETCRKISEKLMGHKVTQETRDKMSKANLGKIIPFESREKISKALVGNQSGATSFLGKTHTLESRMKLSKPVICVETGKIFWSVKSAAECYNISEGNIEAVLNGRQLIAGGVHWRYVDEQLNEKIRTADKRQKSICCKDTGEIFDSIEQAAITLGLNPCGISHVLHRRAKTCCGFHFGYVDKSSNNEIKECSLRIQLLGTTPIPIICVETEKIFLTIKDAAQEVNVSPQSISAVLNGRRMKAGGFHWKYVEDKFNVPEKQPTSSARPVICIETGKIFPSIKAAADAINLRPQAVSGVLNGRGLTAGGFHWKYFEDEINEVDE